MLAFTSPGWPTFSLQDQRAIRQAAAPNHLLLLDCWSTLATVMLWITLQIILVCCSAFSLAQEIRLLLYSNSALRQLNNHLRPNCTETLKHVGIIYPSCPSHLGSGCVFSNHFLSPNSIPSPWSGRISSLYHHNKPHVNLANLNSIPLSSQPIPMQLHLKLALVNICSLNNLSTILN